MTNEKNILLFLKQFHEKFRSKTTGFQEIKSFFRDAKWWFNASWGFKRLNEDCFSVYSLLWYMRVLSCMQVIELVLSSGWRVNTAKLWKQTKHQVKPINPCHAGTVYMRFKPISDQINATLVAKMFSGRWLVNLIITFFKRIFLHRYDYFSSFGAGNCVSNSSFKWTKNNLKQSGR